jgi:hypothetical protein
MVWAYLSFSQFLIIWSANLPEEIPWYQHRLSHGWEVIGIGLVVFHFAVPFIVLLSRRSKRNAALLAGMAMVIVARFWTCSYHRAEAYAVCFLARLAARRPRRNLGGLFGEPEEPAAVRCATGLEKARCTPNIRGLGAGGWGLGRSMTEQARKSNRDKAQRTARPTRRATSRSGRWRCSWPA